MIDSTPYFLIATNLQWGFDRRIKSDIESQYPDKCHTIKQTKNRYRTYLLTALHYNQVEQKINQQVDLSSSTIFEGDLIGSILQYS
jgi:hypothetical protein